MNPKKEKICFLLGLWGRKYIDLFFQYSLPSLLAEGNIPQLSKNFSLSFTFLTQKKDVEYFKTSASIQYLEKFCTVNYENIDDLICENIYSTILTLAYDRGMKVHGYEMLNTYFIFLTSDYIMADGSLQGLAKYINQGYTGICSGNYQVYARSFKKFLDTKFNSDKTILTLPKREMIKESFKNLHSSTLSSLIDQKLVCNYKANRFFTFANQDTLVGRFYLLHMLCIKPETLDYKIGSSCDYSFIPSMCPSGNIAIINDSDDYFVLEMQDHQNEDAFKRYTFMDKNKMATALKEWTTVQHRNNSLTPIYFHSKDLNLQDIQKKTEELSDFIYELNHKIRHKTCKSHLNHFYWTGALKSFDEQRKNQSNYRFKKFSLINLVRQFRNDLMTDKHFFCLKWRDTYQIKKIIQKNITTNQDKVGISYSTDDFLETTIVQWLKKRSNLYFFLDNKQTFQYLQECDFDVFFFFCHTMIDFKLNLEKLNLIKVINPKMKIIFFINNHKLKMGYENTLKDVLLRHHSMGLNEIKIESIKNNFGRLKDFIEKYFVNNFVHHLMLRRFCHLLSLLLLGLMNIISNILILFTVKMNHWGMSVFTVVSGKYERKDVVDAN